MFDIQHSSLQIEHISFLFLSGPPRTMDNKLASIVRFGKCQALVCKYEWISHFLFISMLCAERSIMGKQNTDKHPPSPSSKRPARAGESKTGTGRYSSFRNNYKAEMWRPLKSAYGLDRNECIAQKSSRTTEKTAQKN